MELFLPSLLIFVLAAILIMGVYPYVSPFLLALLAAITMGLVIYQHTQFFQDEYRNITWKDALQGSSGTILITILVVFLIGWLLNLLGKWIWPGKKAPVVPLDVQRYVQNLRPNLKAASSYITPERNVGSTAFYRKYLS
jgi:predicted PurR-regulated permease PerM